MKKRMIIVGAIAIILAVIISNHKNIYRFYKLNQISKDTINSLNGKFSSRIFEKTIKDYECLHKSLEELNHYNITKLVDAYIDILNNGVSMYILKKQGIEQEEYIYKDYGFGHKIGLEYGKDIELEGSDFTEYICYDIKDEDIDNFNNGTFKQKLIEKLKACLDYAEINGKIEWQINSTTDKRIELPYNCYIDYEAYYVKLNTDFKKAISINMKNYNYNKNDSSVKVTYQTNNGKKEERAVRIFKRKDQIYVLVDDILTDGKGSYMAKAKLGSHTVDKISEEESFRQYKEWEETMLN